MSFVSISPYFLLLGFLLSDLCFADDTSCSGFGKFDTRTKTCRCIPGFSGRNCEQQCSGRGMFNMTSNTCQCSSPHFTGRDCSIECGGGGAVRNGVCECFEHWARISDSSCSLCNNQGTLSSSSCSCYPPYSGTACSQTCNGAGHVVHGACICNEPTMGGLLCDQPCSGNGLQQISGQKKWCICNETHSGTACQVTCSGYGAVRDGKCECSALRSGKRCEIECNGRGRALSSSVCDCELGYFWNRTSMMCELDWCGDESHVVDAHGKCVCAALYGGSACSLCSGHGTLNQTDLTRRCDCEVPFTGPSCASTCSTHGVTLTSTPECTCLYGYFGPLCEIECNGHGTYVNNSCQCNPPYKPPLCEIHCNGNGDISESSRCSCYAGYSGDMCQIECSGHGHLVNGKCQCNFGFSGTHCESECNGNGHVTSDQRCDCSKLFSGPNCNISCSGHGSPWIVEGANLFLPFQSMSLFQEYQVTHPSATLQCVCANGFVGADCGSPCSGRGSIGPQGTCVCNSNLYSGDLCQFACSGRGDVVNGACVCNRFGAVGALCELECSGNGHIQNSECICNEGFEAPYCRARCKDMCVHGTCDAEVCDCAIGWGGKWCHLTDCQTTHEIADQEIEICPEFRLVHVGCLNTSHLGLLSDFRGDSTDIDEILQICASKVVDLSGSCLSLQDDGLCFLDQSCDALTNQTIANVTCSLNTRYVYKIEGKYSPASASNGTQPNNTNGNSSHHLNLLSKGTPLWYTVLVLVLLVVVLVGYFVCYYPRRLSRSREPRLFTAPPS